MQKLETKEDREKKESRNKLIVGLILVGIMVLSTAGYAFFSTEKGSTSKVSYGGLTFVLQQDGLWHATIQNYDFSFSFNPKDTENISSRLTLNLMSYNSKPLYFSYDSDKQGVNEIARNIGRFTQRQQYVCLYACDENLPIKNCSDSIISIKTANETLINQEDNCVYIQATQDNITKVSDAFLFKLLGIQ